MGRSTSRRVATASAFAVLAVVSAGACASPTADPPQTVATPRTAGPSRSRDPTAADAERQARAAYAGFMDAWAAASQAADPDNPDLARYAADPLLSLTRHNVRVLRDNGQVQVGAQRATVQRARVAVTTTAATVVLDVCLDYGELRLVYTSNQSPVPGSDISDRRVSAVVTVARYTNGQWLVNDSKRGSDPC